MIDAAPLDNPDTFVAGLPLELLAQLREEEPVHWLPNRRGGGRYVVTSYRYVREFNRDWRQFSSSQLAVSGGEGEHRGQGAITLLEFDPPDHTALRLLVNRGFTPRAIRKLEESAHRIAGDLVEGFVAEGGGDAAELLAAQLPLQV
ncbi:MAG: cytochrome P450, partial [bacterium]|nr:cytochrome P450 [bacterium]